MHVVKLARQGNSTGLTIPADLLKRLDLKRGDEVELSLSEDGIKVTRAKTDYQRAMEAGREGAARYRRALADLAK